MEYPLKITLSDGGSAEITFSSAESRAGYYNGLAPNDDIVQVEFMAPVPVNRISGTEIWLSMFDDEDDDVAPSSESSPSPEDGSPQSTPAQSETKVEDTVIEPTGEVAQMKPEGEVAQINAEGKDVHTEAAGEDKQP